MEESEQEWKEFLASRADLQRRQKEVQVRKSAGKDVSESLRNLEALEKRLKEREEELDKKARLTPWNVDTIAKAGFSRTTINQKERGQEKVSYFIYTTEPVCNM